MRKIKRTLRKLFTQRGKGIKADINLQSVSLLISTLSVLIFIIVQLSTNALLSPLGHKLQGLNSDKNALIESNRALEQVVAETSSITLLKMYSEKEFDIDQTTRDDVVYVTDTALQALR